MTFTITDIYLEDLGGPWSDTGGVRRKPSNGVRFVRRLRLLSGPDDWELRVVIQQPVTVFACSCQDVGIRSEQLLNHVSHSVEYLSIGFKFVQGGMEDHLNLAALRCF